MELKIEGMSCGGCVSSVQRILTRNLEVDADAVEVDLDGGSATVPDDLDAERLQTALAKLAKAGFPATRAG